MKILLKISLFIFCLYLVLLAREASAISWSYVNNTPQVDINMIVVFNVEATFTENDASSVSAKLQLATNDSFSSIFTTTAPKTFTSSDKMQSFQVSSLSSGTIYYVRLVSGTNNSPIPGGVLGPFTANPTTTSNSLNESGTTSAATPWYFMFTQTANEYGPYPSETECSSKRALYLDKNLDSNNDSIDDFTADLASVGATQAWFGQVPTCYQSTTGNYYDVGSTPSPSQVNENCPRIGPGEYCLLEPLPLGPDGTLVYKVNTGDPSSYIKTIIALILAFAGALSLIMIIVGGIKYMGSESVFGKDAGKKQIGNALIGLILAVSAYTILNTLNPKLVDLNIHVKSVEIDIYESEAIVVPLTPSGAPDYSYCRDNKAPDVDEGCVDCRQPSGIVINSSGKNVTDKLADKLESFNGSFGSANWRITEAYIPSTNRHCAQCHYNGTCIDAGLNDKTVANIKLFYDKSIASGLNPIYEVTPEQKEKYNDLINAGVDVRKVKHATAEHFSVYCKSGQTNGC